MKPAIKLQLVIGALFLSATSFSSATSTSSLDGEWQGTYQCAPSPTDPVKVPAYNTSFNLSVSGVEATGSRVAPKVTEVLKGVIDADGKLKLSGIGQLKSGGGKPWTATINGKFAVDTYTGSGGMFGSNGVQLRDCTLSLARVGVTQPNALSVEGSNPQGIPKHLALARELVATVKPANNHYNLVNPTGVHWKGDLFRSENSVDTMCTGLVEAVLEKANNPSISEIKSKTSWKHILRVENFVEAMKKGHGLRRIETVNDVQPGDIFILRCQDDHSCDLGGYSVQGHVAVVDAKLSKQVVKRPAVAGTVQWKLTVIDSNTGAIDPGDTRRTPVGSPKISGVGRGAYLIYTDESGIPVGYSNGWGSKYFGVDNRAIFFARPSS